MVMITTEVLVTQSQPSIGDEPVNGFGLPLAWFRARGTADAVVFAKELRKKEKQFTADDFIAVHVADVTEFWLPGLVDGWIVADREDP